MEFNPARPENMQRTDVRFTCTYPSHEIVYFLFWYIPRLNVCGTLHEGSNTFLNLRTEGVSTTANCGLLASLCSGSSSVRYLVETEYISLPDAKHSGLAHFSFEHSGKYLCLNVRRELRSFRQAKQIVERM